MGATSDSQTGGAGSGAGVGSGGPAALGPNNPNQPPDLTEAEKIVLEHSWNWFALHSGQRMQLLSYFFVALALVVAGYGSALQANAPAVAVGLCGAGLALSGGFFLVDLRTRALVKASEKPISTIQKRLSVLTSNDEINLVERVETPKPWFSSYSKVISALMLVTAVLMAAGIAYALSFDGNDETSHREWQHHHSRHEQGSYAPSRSGAPQPH